MTLEVNMTKKELIAKISEIMNATKKQTELFFSTFEDVVRETVREKKEGIQFLDFFKIICKLRDERSVRNPRTGEIIISPAKYVVQFVAAPSLKNAANNSVKVAAKATKATTAPKKK